MLEGGIFSGTYGISSPILVAKSNQQKGGGDIISSEYHLNHTNIKKVKREALKLGAVYDKKYCEYLYRSHEDLYQVLH